MVLPVKVVYKYKKNKIRKKSLEMKKRIKNKTFFCCCCLPTGKCPVVHAHTLPCPAAEQTHSPQFHYSWAYHGKRFRGASGRLQNLKPRTH